MIPKALQVTVGGSLSLILYRMGVMIMHNLFIMLYIFMMLLIILVVVLKRK